MLFGNSNVIPVLMGSFACYSVALLCVLVAIREDYDDDIWGYTEAFLLISIAVVSFSCGSILAAGLYDFLKSVLIQSKGVDNEWVHTILFYACLL